jgi:hypothetical protein
MERAFGQVCDKKRLAPGQLTRVTGESIRHDWFRLSPALRIENGRFQEPPPEWQILEQQRALIEQAIRALVLIVAEQPSDKPQIVGMGVLVGDYAVLTHISMIGTRNIGQYSVNGMLSVSCADPYWGNIFARQGDDWKILMDTSNTTPATNSILIR